MPQGHDPDPARRRRELSDVLAEEYKAIKQDWRVNAAIGDHQSIDEALTAVENAARNRVPAPSKPHKAAEQARRKLLYKVGYQLDLSALCLSGGGIRSAAISLGVIQALVDHQLLNKFEYLSTVSGGGYIGSWLSAWLYRVRKANGSSDDVLKRLGSRRNAPDVEVPPLDHLREYSNYLTPKLGLFSADTWAALAIVLRNLVVNWLILLPALAILVTVVKLVALALTAPAFQTPAVPPPDWHPPVWTWAEVIVAILCLLCGSIALGYKLSRLYLPPYSEGHQGAEQLADQTAINAAQGKFIRWSLTPAVIGGCCFVWLAYNNSTPGLFLTTSWSDKLLPMTLFAGGVYVLAIGFGQSWARNAAPNAGDVRGFNMYRSDLLSWVGAVAVFAVLLWLGANGIGSLGNAVTGAVSVAGVTVQREALIVIFGVPWFLMATMVAHDIYLLLDSTSDRGDVEREWLGRASGWHFIAGLAWIMLSTVVLLGPAVYYNVPQAVHVLTVVSGAVTALLGKSGLTSATGGQNDWKGLAANIGLAVAGPLFAVLLLILLSVVIDWLVFGYPLPCLPTNSHWDRCHSEWWPWFPYSWRWGLPLVLSGLTLWIADRCVNVNAFSLHSVYRNRLIRCFLGGARDPHRHPDGFTDFDWDDDLRVAELWAERPAPGEWRPFHVINMTLNVAETNRLSWQQRKAMPFSVTPLYCGNADLGYRPTRFYAGPQPPAPAPNPAPVEDQAPNAAAPAVADGAPAADAPPPVVVAPAPDAAQPPNAAQAQPQPQPIRTGISLGTAMAISGAAVSSNMGYHSSMSLSFLLTFFNVRLGVWLGNTKATWDGKKDPFYTHEGPRYAIGSLLNELFGLTTDDRPYVYLSDGGHFEDLGLYEMVRRRCRRILIVDGDQDGKRGFADLGNAVRKIWIDLGVRISFKESKLLEADAETEVGGIPYFAVGTIDYLSDERDVAEKQPQGHILYIKPVVRGDEHAADVIAYQRANRAFPAQSTANQWFDESQFESYRRLGHLMAEQIILSSGMKTEADQSLASLFRCLENIDQQTMGPKAKGAKPEK
jgi:Patatin-like phospholipase